MGLSADENYRSILIVEDDLKLRRVLELHLEEQGNEVIAVSDGNAGLDSLKTAPVDAILLDIRLPDITGTEVLKRIGELYPTHPPVIIITGHGDKNIAIESLRYGAADFIEKPFPPQRLDTALSNAIEKNGEAISSFKSLLFNKNSGKLTPREADVANLVSEGFSNDEVGKRLSMGGETVKSHLKNIFRKLGVKNRTALSTKHKQR